MLRNRIDIFTAADTAIALALGLKSVSVALTRIIPVCLLGLAYVTKQTEIGNFESFLTQMGTVTFLLLFFVLAIKPLSDICPKVKILTVGKKLRKELGLLSFYTALFIVLDISTPNCIYLIVYST